MQPLMFILIQTTSFSIDQGDRPSPGESEVDVEMKRCDAYEVVRLSRQRVTMKDNPAYVDVALANTK